MRLTDRKRAAELKANADVKYKKPTLYYCDPVKRPRCEKTECYLHGGYCELTEHKEFARTDDNGNAIEYKEYD